MRLRVVIAAVVATCGLAVALVAGPYAGGMSAAAEPAERVRLILQWEPQAQFAGYYMALEKGFYRERGLDVEIVPGGPAIDSIAYLESGRAEFATAFLTGAITAAADGTPVVAVCQVVNRSSLFIVARREVIKDRDDLDGRRVSVWGTSFRAAYLGYFETAGIEPRIVPQYYSVNLFLQGGVDACAAMEYNEYHSIVQAGVDQDELTTFSMRDAGFGFPEDGVYALAETVRRDPRLSREFAAASMEGWDYCRRHPDEAVSRVMEYAQKAHVPTNRVHQRWMLDHVLAAIYPGEHDRWQPGVLSRVDYERTRAIMIGEGLIAGAPAYERFVAAGRAVLSRLPIAWRITTLVVLGAGLVLGAVSVYSYWEARDFLEQQKRAEIRATAQATANRIEVVGRAVEKVVEGLALSVDDAEPGRVDARRLLRRTVVRNEELFGAAIGYQPVIYGHFAPYAYEPSSVYGSPDDDDERPEGELIMTDLGRGGRAYEVNDWFQLPVQMRQAVWTEPYYDEGGGDIVMATYACPVHLRRDPVPVSAVVTGDVSLYWLTRLLEGLDLGETGYAFIISQTGTFIAHPTREFIMNESIFSVAEARQEPGLRAVGRRMIAGHTGYAELDGIRTLAPEGPSWMAYRPVPSTGWSVGIVFADSEISADVVALSRIQWLLAFGGIAALLIVALVIAGSITRPIHVLDSATRTLALGDLGAPLPQAKGRDEIAHLTTSFARMRDDLQRHVEELRQKTAAHERIASELRIATTIQMSLVPRTFPPYPERRDLELNALLDPAREVGGDFYDFFLLDDDHLCLAIADVSGKGVPAALLMAVTRSFLRSLAREGGGPAEILAKVNDELAADNDECMFVTMFLAVADLRSGVVTYASAGHNRQFVVAAAGGATQLPRVRGIALGAKAGLDYAEDALDLAPGDTLFLYTDGVSEAMNAADEVFGEDRLGEELERLCGGTCDEALVALLATLDRHAEGVEQSDDITMVAFRWLGRGDAQDGPGG